MYEEAVLVTSLSQTIHEAIISDFVGGYKYMVSLNYYLIHENLGAYAGISEITNSVYRNTQNRHEAN
jgi:hypothetical protein